MLNQLTRGILPHTVDGLLAQDRSRLVRLSPAAAYRAVRSGALLIDTRPEWQRRTEGEIPGAWTLGLGGATAGIRRGTGEPVSRRD